MKDAVHAIAKHSHQAGVVNVSLDEFHAVEAGEVGAFARDEIVNAAHRVALCQKSFGNGASNEPGSAGNKK